MKTTEQWGNVRRFRSWRGMVVAGAVFCALGLAPAPLVLMPPAAAQSAAAAKATEDLFQAVAKNDLAAARAAVDAGADIDARNVNGMQAIDLAIDRGYYEVAHYLISIRNQLAAAKAAAQPVAPEGEPVPALEAQPQQEAQPLAEAAPPPLEGPSPFDAAEVDNGLEVIGQVQPPQPASETMAQAQPAPKPAPQAQPAQPQPAQAAASAAQDKSSATKEFFTTFFDFFDPPNTTGVVRKPEAAQPVPVLGETGSEVVTAPVRVERPEMPELPDIPLPVQEEPREEEPQPLETAQPDEQPATDALGELTITDTEQEADMQPPSTDPLANLEIGDAAPAEEVAAAPKTPPAATGELVPDDQDMADLMTLLDKKPATQEDVFSLDEGGTMPSLDEIGGGAPAAQPETDGLGLPGLDTIEPQDVAKLPETAPPPEGGGLPGLEGLDGGPAALAKPDPLAGLEIPSTPTQPTAGVSELEGLGLELTTPAKDSGSWPVTAVESGAMPPGVPRALQLESTGDLLDGVELQVVEGTRLGQEVGEERLARMQENTIRHPCVAKGAPGTYFCIDTLNWPLDVEEWFLVDTIMYQGTRAITRYDNGKASNFHVLFKTEVFDGVVDLYVKAYGPPTKIVTRAIAPLAAPRRDNPTIIWQSREAGTDTVTTLEIRQFDDARGGFPDTQRGAILLYKSQAGPIFPHLSQLELMVLKPDPDRSLAAGGNISGGSTPDPSSVW